MEFETLGYILSPAKPPIVKAALLEDRAGEVSIGDLIAIPIVLDSETMYILGNVLSIDVFRPLLDESSKAPFALSRGDKMNLYEDVDMLEISELEDIAYVATLYVHTFLYNDKRYPVHVIVPGSKIVKVPEEIFDKFLKPERPEIGKIRNTSKSLRIDLESIYKGNLAIISEEPYQGLKLALKIADMMNASVKLYLGPHEIGRKTFEGIPSDGARTLHHISDVKPFLEEYDKIVLISEMSTILGMPFAKNDKVATIVVTRLHTSYRGASSAILFPITPKSFSTRYKEDIAYRLRLGLAQDEFLAMGKAFGDLIVVGGAAGI